jgi:hypothetical protein
MKSIFPAAKFVKRAHRELRQGELSREPVQLLRLEWRPEGVECDWLMRPADPWDRDVAALIARENQAVQALRDALTLRNLIFKSFPKVGKAELRMFRLNEAQELELMMTGSVARENEIYERVASMVMRAKLCGFQFTLSHGALVRQP